MTTDRVRRFVKNFNERVRGTDLDVDYEHKERTGAAAGWFEALQDRGPDGLWAKVSWTKRALTSLQDREYRYFSPEYVDQWKRPSDGRVFTDVLFGGAITNRPFLKEILPINLSDFPEYQQGDNDVEELLRQFAEALGVQLSDNADSDTQAVLTAVRTLAEKAKAPPPPAPKPDEDPALKKLAEDNPLIAKLLADREEDAKRLAILEASNRLAEVSRKLSDLNTDKRAIPPAFSDTMRGVLVQLNEKHADKVIEALKDLMKTGLVELGERSSSKTGADRGEDADVVKKFQDRVDKVMEEKKLSYRDAVGFIGSNEPELWDDYSEAILKKVDA
jgi:predicted Zn-dependent protease with MMP-like domain